MSYRITTVWAFLSVNGDDEEGIIGMNLGDGWMPFVCADAARVESLRPLAVAITSRTGRGLTLARFSVREDVEVVPP
jgi:hypothetical protein